MITQLAGLLIEKQPTAITLDVNGVGYEVLIPTSTYEALPAKGIAARLFTHLHVREDALVLFGFATRAERSVFLEMLAVTGVGPKLALAALSAMRPGEIRDHIVTGDAGFLTRIPGIGRKTAERLIVELKDRLLRLDLGGDAGSPRAERGARADALSALEALGFGNAAAEKVLRAVEKKHPDETSVEALIRLALREQ